MPNSAAWPRLEMRYSGLTTKLPVALITGGTLRKLVLFGHDVRLVAPQFVKPSVGFASVPEKTLGL